MNTRMNCEQVEVLLAARLDGTLDRDERAEMEAHMAGCDECRVMVSDIERIVADARGLPALSPAHDLWSGIASQLGAQESGSVAVEQAGVQSLASWKQSRAGISRWSPSFRTMAAAAVLLVAVTAAVTWNIAHMSAGSVAVPQVAQVPDAANTSLIDSTRDSRQVVSDSQPSVTRNVRVERRVPTASARVASNEETTRRVAPREVPTEVQYVGNADVAVVYEREIAALREIVDKRFAELDSLTVSELRRNLDIIDRAIADSRDALRRDPGSHLVSRQLDRALEHKMELLRRVALL